MNSTQVREKGSCSDISDEDLESAVADLCSYKIPKLGPNRARQIVLTYGRLFEEALDAGPDGIALVTTIDPSTRSVIAKGWALAMEMRQAKAWLSSIKVSPELAERLWEDHRSIAPAQNFEERLRNDPYDIVMRGIVSFAEMDTLREALGISRSDKTRMACGMLGTLNLRESAGDTQYEHVSAITQTARKLGIARQDLAEVIWTIDRHNLWTNENDSQGWTQISKSSTLLTERKIADFVRSRSNLNHYGKNSSAINAVSSIVANNGFPIDEEQTETVLECLRNSLTIVTGRAGTGKTTIMKVLVSACKRAGLRVGGCAPTGLAAARLQHVTGMRCRTMHRLLGISRDGTRNQRNNEIEEYDVLIADEFSMVGTFLAENLTSAIGPGTTLILLGDTEQLSSIEPGSILRDLASSPLVRRRHLTRVYRQGNNHDGSIVRAAWNVLDGEMPTFTESAVFIEQRDETKTASWIPRIAQKIVSQGVLPSSLRVISPIRSGVLGVTALSQRIRECLNPVENEDIAESDLRPGDEIIYTENDETLGLSNGDLGCVVSVNSETGYHTIQFSRKRVVVLGTDEVANVKHAMALTGHQTQGNEFSHVIIPLAESHRNMLDRAWLYTAIARARDRVILVGSPYALKSALERRPRSRNTGLRNMIGERS